MNSTNNNNRTDLSIPSITPGEEVIYCLMNLDGTGSNIPRFTCQGAYTVDWGDGEVNKYRSNDTAYHAYSYTPGDDTQVIFKVTPLDGHHLTYVDFGSNDDYNSVYEYRDYNYLELVVNTPNATVIKVCDYDGITTERLISFSSPENKVTNMSFMFQSCPSLQVIPKLDTSSVTCMYNMFSECDALQAIPLLDTSNVTNMEGMFYNCTALETIPMLDTSKVTRMVGMFQGCGIESIPMLNTHQVTDMEGMFQECRSLQSIPLLDTSNVTNMYCMFLSCTALKSIPVLDTSKVTSMEGMFYNCTALQTIPKLDTSRVRNMSFMFIFCYSLQSIPQLDTSKVTTMSNMFNGCTALQTVPLLDASQVTNMTDMFGICTAITEVILNTAKASFNVSNSKLSTEAINTLFTGLGAVSDKTINISGNPGSDTCDKRIATSKGWTVIG